MGQSTWKISSPVEHGESCRDTIGANPGPMNDRIIDPRSIMSFLVLPPRFAFRSVVPAFSPFLATNETFWRRDLVEGVAFRLDDGTEF